MTLNEDNSFFVNDNLDKYEFEIITREISIVIDYVDNEENRHGSCSSMVINDKVYLSFNSDPDYKVEKLWINGQEISFKGKIYSLDANKDLFVIVKFFKR